MDVWETIKVLCDIPGVSGDEGAVRDAIRDKIEARCDAVETDPLGNLLAFKKGRRSPKQKILLSAHMDEVGFIVTYVEDSGLLRFAAVGGIDSRIIVGKRVEIGKNRLPGVIGTKAVHLQDAKEREQVLPADKLYMDIGAQSGEEAAKSAPPGTRAVFSAPFWDLGDGKLMARALDDRAGCAVLIALLHMELEYDCWFSFTAQEETGCVGGLTAGYRIAPDIAVAVEATTASDIPGAAPDRVVCKLGKGPAVSFMDRGTVYDAGLYAMALAEAEKHGIPCQSKEGVFGGNEAKSLQIARSGARVLAVSLPCRYLHSPSCVVAKEDVGSAVRLLHAFIGAVGA